MKNYIVINSETIQKRIEEYKKDITFLLFNNEHELATNYNIRIEILNSVLSNSKPLTPIIEDALKEGMLIQRTINERVKIPATRIKDYINNLKLDI